MPWSGRKQGVPQLVLGVLHLSLLLLGFFAPQKQGLCFVLCTSPHHVRLPACWMLLQLITVGMGTALCLSQHQYLCLKVAGRCCKSKFTFQIQTRSNRSITRGDMDHNTGRYAERRVGRVVQDNAGPRANSAYRVVVPNCQLAKEIFIFNIFVTFQPFPVEFFL